MSATAKSFRSGDVARLTGVSSDTIRHYERMGILPQSPRTASGYRMYGRDTVDRVHLVQRALQLGFSLSELAEILQTRDGGGAPCHRVLNLTEEKLGALEQRMQELRQTQRYMRQLIHDWRAKLAYTKPGSKAMLLHSLTDIPVTQPRPVHNLKRRKQS